MEMKLIYIYKKKNHIVAVKTIMTEVSAALLYKLNNSKIHRCTQNR
jgi:hypothetical protein